MRGHESALRLPAEQAPQRYLRWPWPGGRCGRGCMYDISIRVCGHVGYACVKDPFHKVRERLALCVGIAHMNFQQGRRGLSQSRLNYAIHCGGGVAAAFGGNCCEISSDRQKATNLWGPTGFEYAAEHVRPRGKAFLSPCGPTGDIDGRRQGQRERQSALVAWQQLECTSTTALPACMLAARGRMRRKTVAGIGKRGGSAPPPPLSKARLAKCGRDRLNRISSVQWNGAALFLA